MRLIFGDPAAIRARDSRPNARAKRFQQQPPKFSKVLKPMTDEDIRLALALSACRFGAGTWDKKYARSMGELANGKKEMTDAQRWHLYRMVHRYRRQIDPRLVERAVVLLDAESHRV